MIALRPTDKRASFLLLLCEVGVLGNVLWHARRFKQAEKAVCVVIVLDEKDLSLGLGLRAPADADEWDLEQAGCMSIPGRVTDGNNSLKLSHPIKVTSSLDGFRQQ